MRVITLACVLALMSAAVQAAPFNVPLPDGETKDALQSATDETHHESFAGFAADGLPGDIKIAVVNATPYRWRLSHCHSHQLTEWGQKKKHNEKDKSKGKNKDEEEKKNSTNWPTVIESGVSYEYQIRNRVSLFTGSRDDTAGEVVYELEGTSRPMAFEIQYNGKSLYSYEIHVQFRGDLETKTSPKNTRVLIANEHTSTVEKADDLAGCSFHIAGKEGDFTSTTDWNNPPQGGWMQDLLPAIGDKPLRNIVMPRSHHAAMDVTKSGHSIKSPATWDGQVVTQRLPIQQQLRAEGIRVLDERVHLSKKRGYHHAHLDLHGSHAGAYGRSIKEVISAINDFNDENPGELIIWDFHATTANLDKKHWPGFTAKERQDFYTLLKSVKHRASLPKDMNDYTFLTLNDLIGNGTSAVILRFNRWDGLPGPEEGFVDTWNFPGDDRWSEMYDPCEVAEDQMRFLDTMSSRDGIIHGMQLLRTLVSVNSAFPPYNMGLVDMAREMMTWFRGTVWGGLTDEKYPNWLTMDGFEGGEMKGFIIAMNKCFVAKECGDWTGARMCPYGDGLRRFCY